MKLFKGSLLVLAAFSFAMFFSLFPVSVNSAYVWERCTSAITCEPRTIGVTEWRCHRSPSDGVWKWEISTAVKAKIESNKNFAGICSDGYDNNCNNAVDSADAADCIPPSTYVYSVGSSAGGVDYSSPWWITANGANNYVTAASPDLTEKMSCRWGTTDVSYSSMSSANECTPDSYISLCTLGALAQGSYTRYVSCKDINDNGQGAANNLDVAFGVDWSAPSVTFTANKPSDQTGTPYDIEIVISDAYSGVQKSTIKVFVSNDDGATWADKTAAWFPAIPGSCETAGNACTLTHAVSDGGEASDGYHKLKVEATDNAGNAITPPVRRYLVSTCKLNSVSVTPTASVCTKLLSNCGAPGSACGAGNTFDVSATYTGLNCPVSFNVQVDAKSSEIPAVCVIQSSGGDMSGMSISCSNPTSSASAKTCTGTWTLPTPIHPDCQSKTVSPFAACLKKSDGDICIFSGFSGSPGMCKDTTDTINLQLSLQSDVGCVPTRSISATTMSAMDAVYGLKSCTLDWKDGAATVKTVTKTCDADTKADCAAKFSSADKSYSYSSDGAKSATLSCTNANSLTKEMPKSVIADTSTPVIGGIKAYKDSTKAVSITGSGWQTDTDPYFEWTPAASLCGVKYYVTADGTEPDATKTERAVNNYIHPSNFGNAKHQVKAKPLSGAGVWGSTQTFNLWVDTVAPATSIQESIPAWFTYAPTLHLACADNPASPADNSGCSSTQYCLTAGCTPSTAYTAAGITLSSSATLNYMSTDGAGNVEATKSKKIDIDTTPPPAPTVTDSGVYTKDTAELTFSWTQVIDSQSGINGYQYAIGTCTDPVQACFTGVRGYTYAAWAPSVTVSGLSLVDASKYYISVRAENGAGSFGPAGSSDGIIVDARGPSGIDSLVLERSYGGYVSGPFAVFTLPRTPLPSLSDPSGVKTDSCRYTVDDGNTWKNANWNITDSSCKISKIDCSDGDTLKVKMRVSDSLGNAAETSTASDVICDTTPPDTPSLTPSKGTVIHTASREVSFFARTKDAKSGVDVIAWELHRKNSGDSTVGTKVADCGAAKDVFVTCEFRSTVFLASNDLMNSDRLYVKARADDHVDPWSGWEESGQWMIDQDAPIISAITPTTAALGVPQSYSASVTAQPGKTISLCALVANGGQVSNMALTSGTTSDGVWSGSYTIPAPVITFMRAHCEDNIGNEGDGIDTPVSLATETTSNVNPSTVEKLQVTNITARYATKGGSSIADGKCWVSSSDYKDPATGIAGSALLGINDGYYTYSFAAPTISGTYNYEVSCAKAGYQTASDTKSFTVLGCEGPVCIKVAPANTIAILKLGETQNVNLNLKNRGDVENTYSVRLNSPNPNVAVGIAPTHVTLKNGEEKRVNVQLTSLVISDEPITLTIIVENTATGKEGDSAAMTINSSIAVGSVPGLGALEILAIFAAASLLVYRKTGL